MKMVATVMGIMIGFVNLVIPPHFNRTNLQEDGSEIFEKSTSEYNSELWNPNGYCDIERCKIITCSNMLKQGMDVSVIILNFKTKCPHERQISSLKFRNCRFSEGKLNFLLQFIEFSIINLIFEECLFDSIGENAFSSPAFESTKHVEIINGSVRKLPKGIFKKFYNLVSLTIRDTLIEEAEYNLLEYVADVLQIIELDRSIRNEKVVKNITSGSQLLRVELISLQGNNIPHLSSEILGGFPNILSIYLDSSQIKHIDVDAFHSLKSVKQIFLNNNFLTTLDENIFNSIILRNPNVRIMMTNNPWNCNCSLKWIEKLINEKPNLLGIIPKCKTPEINYGLNFIEANFCLTNTSESLVDMKNCENIILPFKKSSSFPMGINDFHIKEYYENGSIIINLKASSNPQVLMWYKSSDIISNIACLTIGVNSSIVYLHDIKKNSSYTICLLNTTRGPSFFNCLSMIIPPFSQEKMIWLKNNDKPIAIIIVLSITTVFFIIGGVVTFFIILKHPQLIRASPRVIMVKRGKINAMILPKGVLWREGGGAENYNLRPEYLTPISKRTNLIFQGNYYDSISKISSQYLRNDKTCSNNYAVPPPLPPHPKFGMSKTVSQAVEPECPDFLEPGVYFL